MITSAAYAHGQESELYLAVNREAAFMASMMASSAMIYLHMVSPTSCVFQCGIDSTLIPSAVAAQYVRVASGAIFELLRASLRGW